MNKLRFVAARLTTGLGSAETFRTSFSKTRAEAQMTSTCGSSWEA